MVKEPRTLWAALALVAASVAPVLADDEVDELVKQLEPPARFADHVPNFSVKQQEFTFASPRGPVKRTWSVIMDGDRHVALYRPHHLFVISHDPTKAPKKLVMPIRHNMVTQHAVYVTTSLWWDSCERDKAEFSGGVRTLAITYVQEWTPRGKHKCTAKSVRVHTLRCDPVFGYVVDIDCRLATDKVPSDRRGKKRESLEFVNFYVSGLSNPWPGRWRYDHTVYCPAAGDKFGKHRYAGWVNNCVAADRSDGGRRVLARSSGFVAFLADKEGWSPALTRTGDYTFELRTCNVWQDQHNLVHFPKKPDDDGLYRVNPKFRLVYLPPEITAHVLKKMTLEDFGGARAVMIRIAVKGDFEGQPLPLTTPIRGAYGHGLRVSTEKAHSGKKSLVFKGGKDPKTRGHFLFVPQIPLDADSRYLLEAWAFVEGDDTEACVTGDLYEHSPHSRGRLVRQQTTSARSGEGWKHIKLEFDTSPTKIDPYIDLRFRVVGPGKAYFDDFRLVKIDGPQSRRD